MKSFISILNTNVKANRSSVNVYNDHIRRKSGEGNDIFQKSFQPDPLNLVVVHPELWLHVRVEANADVQVSKIEKKIKKQVNSLLWSIKDWETERSK